MRLALTLDSDERGAEGHGREDDGSRMMKVQLTPRRGEAQGCRIPYMNAGKQGKVVRRRDVTGSLGQWG